MNLPILSEMELRVLQHAIDELIPYYEDALPPFEPDDRDARIAAAYSLKQRLDVVWSIDEPHTQTPPDRR